MLCQGSNQIMLICEVDDPYTMYVFATKGTQAIFGNLYLQQYEGNQPTWKEHFKNEH